MLYKNRIVEGYSSSQNGIIIYHRPTCFCLYQSAIEPYTWPAESQTKTESVTCLLQSGACTARHAHRRRLCCCCGNAACRCDCWELETNGQPTSTPANWFLIELRGRRAAGITHTHTHTHSCCWRLYARKRASWASRTACNMSFHNRPRRVTYT